MVSKYLIILAVDAVSVVSQNLQQLILISDADCDPSLGFARVTGITSQIYRVNRLDLLPNLTIGVPPSRINEVLNGGHLVCGRLPVDSAIRVLDSSKRI